MKLQVTHKKIQCRITRQLFATLQKRETEASKSGNFGISSIYKIPISLQVATQNQWQNCKCPYYIGLPMEPTSKNSTDSIKKSTMNMAELEY
jgi:hypothetical protein